MENETKRVFRTAENGRSWDWSELPADLMPLILRHLKFVDHLSFCGVCKSWRRALEQCTLENQLPAQPYWVIFSRKLSTGTESSISNGGSGDSIRHFGDSSTKRTYAIDVPELSRTRCLVSKHGWLLLFSSEPISSLFFFNPFSRARIDLPWRKDFSGLIDTLDKQSPVFTLSTPPSSPDCVLFAVAFLNEESFRISTCRRGETTWTAHDYKRRKTKFAPIKDAMFCTSTGMLYWVDELGFIRTYKADVDKWRRFRSSTPMRIRTTRGGEIYSYMVEPTDKNPMMYVYYEREKTLGRFCCVELESPPNGWRSKLEMLLNSPKSQYCVNPGKKTKEVPGWLCMDTFRAGSWCISFDSFEDDDHRPVLFSWGFLDKTECAGNCQCENSIWIEPRWIQPSPSIEWTV